MSHKFQLTLLGISSLESQPCSPGGILALIEGRDLEESTCLQSWLSESMELPVIQFIGNRKALKEEVEGQVGCPLAFPKLLFSCLHGNVHSLTCAY